LLLEQGRFWQVDRVVNVNGAPTALLERPQLDLPFLAAAGVPGTALATNQMVVVIDQNRVSFPPEQWWRLQLAVVTPQGQAYRVQLNPTTPVISMTRWGGMWVCVVQR
jgi:hypothetical protein